MVRIKGVDIPDNKRIEIALTSIHGVGKNLSKEILESAKIDVNKKTKDLDNKEIVKITDELDNHLVEGDLRREVNANIKTKMEINCYQGVRHRRGLPVRGQRTSRNARTRKGKGKVVANKRKASK